MQRTTRVMALVLAGVPLVGVAVLGAGGAQAGNPSKIVIEELDAIYKGPRSSAGDIPKVDVSASQVAQAFVDMTSVGKVRKVVKSTDGKATERGSVVKTHGFRCKATKYKVFEPGTAGMHSKVTWLCTFQAADTASEVTLQYRQTSIG